jgi:hypothetical protein
MVMVEREAMKDGQEELKTEIEACLEKMKANRGKM